MRISIKIVGRVGLTKINRAIETVGFLKDEPAKGFEGLVRSRRFGTSKFPQGQIALFKKFKNQSASGRFKIQNPSKTAYFLGALSLPE